MDPLDERQEGQDTYLVIWMALLDACSWSKVATGKTLIDFFVKHGLLWKLIGSSYPADPLWRTMGAGCIELFKYLLANLKDIDPAEYRPHLAMGYMAACSNAHTALVRHLLENNWMPPTQVYMHDHEDTGEPIFVKHPLAVAAKNCHISVMQVLIKHSTRIQYLSRNTLTPQVLEYGVLGLRSRTIMFLLYVRPTFFDEHMLDSTSNFAHKLNSVKRLNKDHAETLLLLVAGLKANSFDDLGADLLRRSWENLAVQLRRVLDATSWHLCNNNEECYTWLLECAASAREEYEECEAMEDQWVWQADDEA